MKTAVLLLTGVVGAWSAAGSAAAIGSANSVLVYDTSGSPRCADIASNALELRITSSGLLAPGTTRTANNADGQSISYTIDDSGMTVSTWSVRSKSLQPVSFALLKSNVGTRVFFFSAFGAVTDQNEQAAGSLTQLSFCYGMATPLQPTTLPACDANWCSTLSGDPQRVLITLAPGAPQWDVQMCTCGAVFTECDPFAEAGTSGACTNANGYLRYVPVGIEAGQDPASYVCTTIGGKRRCYYR